MTATGCSKPPAAAPTVAASQLDSLLLTPAEASTVLGATDLQVTVPLNHNAAGEVPIAPPACLGAYEPASTIEGTGYLVVTSETLADATHIAESRHNVQQAVFNFSTAAQAASFVQAQSQQWQSCANKTLTYTGSNGKQEGWDSGPVEGAPPAIAMRLTERNTGGWTCQRALRSASNVVIDVNSCAYDTTTNRGNQVADAVAAKVPH
ncbi:sensor domain-containing protein [Nocardia sp. NPDC101769]|uniref:sensor domain-containing protein n=1 Tax=Nocardia sp. NPDC101769 TaxID=3364333 RepID=UPI0038134722